MRYLSSPGVSDKFEQLLNTVTMRHILVEMCNHPERHDLDEGFGMLEPWNILGDNESMKELLQHYTEPENTEYWAGKNIYFGDKKETDSTS